MVKSIFVLISFIILIAAPILGVINGDNTLLIGGLFMGLFAGLIFYHNLKEGYRIPIQIIELKGEKLFVTYKILFFKYTWTYNLSRLSIEEVDRWNLLSGNKWPTKYPYARLKVNNDVTLPHIYKLNQLEQLVEEFEK